MNWKPEIVRAICKRCSGRCCTNPRVHVVMDYEVENGGLKRFKVTFEDGMVVLQKDAFGVCIYFDQETRLCRIYARRPRSCRSWFCGRETKNDETWKAMAY
jgi:Fe-S-cluster containining protein